MSKIHSLHDAFAKRCLTDLALAKDFLKIHLPEKLKEACDFESLKIEPTSFIEEDLRQHTTDILYSLRMDNKPGFIYCLIENQSKPEKLMPLRFLRYQTSIWKHFAENNKNPDKGLPIIVPLLFYTGQKSPYPYSLDLLDCFDNSDLAKQTFLMPAKLIDLSQLSDEEIKSHGSAALLELVQKHIRDRDLLMLAYDVCSLMNHFSYGRDLALDVIKYLVIKGEDKDVGRIIDVIKEQSQYRSEAVTLAEQLRQQGIQQGIQEGIEKGIQVGEIEKAKSIAKNLLAKGIDFAMVKEVTGLSDSELNSLLFSH